MPRPRFTDVRLTAGLALGLALLAAGCGESTSTDFHSYDQLERADDDQATAETEPGQANSRSNDEAAAELAEKGANGHQASITDADVQNNGNSGAAPSEPPAEATPAVDHGDVPAIAEKPLAEDVPPAAPRKIELLVKDRAFQTEGGALRVSYDDIDLLKVLNMEPVPPEAPSLMPDWLRQLDGKRIRIRGFMYPPFQETGIDAFVLARDNQICCFGRNPKIYDLVEVRMRPGVTTDYIQNRPFDVVGTFHIEPKADLDLLRLYWIDDATVVVDR